MASPASAGPVIDQTTVLSLLLTVLLLLLAYFLSLRLLPSASSPRTRILFIWHAFDSLIHTLLEGSFLYHCFSTYTAITRPEMLSALVDSASGGKAPARDPPLVTAPGVHFLGREGRLYGPGYIDGSGQGGGLMAPMARLWMEYAKADRRWGGADLGVVSLECLTVFIGAPLAAYVCYLLAKEGDVGSKRRLGGRASFWMTVLATMELYGGFMTFAPEWLTGNPNLDTSNWMYLWLYLVFFNMLWVALPLYALYQTYASVLAAADTDSADTKKKN